MTTWTVLSMNAFGKTLHSAPFDTLAEAEDYMASHQSRLCRANDTTAQRRTEAYGYMTLAAASVMLTLVRMFI